MPGDYTEVLRVPLRWWAVATTFHATVLVAFLVATPVVVAVAITGVLAAANAALFIGYGGARLEVAEGHFRAGRARIAVSLLADPQPLDEEQTRRALGPDADARAFLLVRPYARESVMVLVADPADPAPYWLVSTRRPRELTGALSGAIRGAR